MSRICVIAGDGSTQPVSGDSVLSQWLAGALDWIQLLHGKILLLTPCMLARISRVCRDHPLVALPTVCTLSHDIRVTISQRLKSVFVV